MERRTIGFGRLLIGCLVVLVAVSCSSKQSSGGSEFTLGGATASGGGSNGGNSSAGDGAGGSGTGGVFLSFGGKTACTPKTCKELGYACGAFKNECGGITRCEDEGLKCSPLQVCSGGMDGPTQCKSSISSCALCGSVPDCSSAPQPTRITGRVVTPGRADDETANQVGVPNAVVYILRTNELSELPAMGSGIPTDGTSCDRCDDQSLGPVLVGTITDSAGRFTLEGTIPVGEEFTLVTKVGRFRRAVKFSLPASAACQTNELPLTLPGNPTRLPRSMSDGLAVNIPSVAVTTGEIDAMECVLEKMGIAVKEFGNPGTPARVHLYRGGSSEPGGSPGGARIDGDTPSDKALYSDLASLLHYDLLVADCEGASWDQGFTQRDDYGAFVREYVNRGGRMFASHLSFSWLIGNGAQPYDATTPIATGLGAAATWDRNPDSASITGVTAVSLGRPQASPRIQSFADWMAAEGVITPPDATFNVTQPRSAVTALGAAAEEFAYRTDGNKRIQQFSFNTPYGGPSESACGRVAYSGFHVAANDGSGDPFKEAVFPEHCAGNLTPQEKVLLYMLFDLGACVGSPPPPPECNPTTCAALKAECGYAPDGCGNVLDCGVCPPPK